MPEISTGHQLKFKRDPTRLKPGNNAETPKTQPQGCGLTKIAGDNPNEQNQKPNPSRVRTAHLPHKNEVNNMNALAITPEAAIDKIMTQLNELEKIPGMSGATAASIISHCKAEMTALRRLSVTQRYQHTVRANQQANCKELYAHPVPAQLRLSVSH